MSGKTPKPAFEQKGLRVLKLNSRIIGSSHPALSEPSSLDQGNAIAGFWLFIFPPFYQLFYRTTPKCGNLRMGQPYSRGDHWNCPVKHLFLRKSRRSVLIWEFVNKSENVFNSFIRSVHSVECPNYTTCDDKTSTTHFLVPFCILI